MPKAESSITDIPRLEDSRLGKWALVRRGPARHGVLSLMVGDSCMVELSQP